MSSRDDSILRTSLISIPFVTSSLTTEAIFSSLISAVMRSSAKGVLIVPEESIPDGYTIDDIASQWALFNGVIPVKTRNGAMLPQQVSANAVNVGISELLNTQLHLMEDISGVTGALQGKAASAGMSGRLYEQQTQNASISQLDLLDAFHSFLDEARRKDESNLRQYVLGESASLPSASPSFAVWDLS